MITSTKAKCEKYAAEHNLTIEIFGSRGTAYSVDLPTGMITETGATGLGGEAELEQKMPEVWGAIMQDMKALVDQEWLVNTDL